MLGCQTCNQDTNEKWWLLTRQNNSGVGERAIILYNETLSTIEKKLPIPATLSSPHALDFDGKTLWVGGAGTNESLYELDPGNGAVISTIPNIRTEGISLVQEGIWYSATLGGNLVLIRRDGTIRATSNVNSNTVQDIAAYGFCKMYYVVNGATDPIIEVDLLNKTENTILDTQVSTLYTLTIKDGNFIVIGSNNEIIRFDMVSGAKVSANAIPVSGWITAIAPYSK